MIIFTADKMRAEEIKKVRNFLVFNTSINNVSKQWKKKTEKYIIKFNVKLYIKLK